MSSGKLHGQSLASERWGVGVFTLVDVCALKPLPMSVTDSGSEKGVFWKRGLFREEVHFVEIQNRLQ